MAWQAEPKQCRASSEARIVQHPFAPSASTTERGVYESTDLGVAHLYRNFVAEVRIDNRQLWSRGDLAMSSAISGFGATERSCEAGIVRKWTQLAGLSISAAVLRHVIPKAADLKPWTIVKTGQFSKLNSTGSQKVSLTNST